MRAERESSRWVFPPNPEGEILDVLVPCPSISVFTVMMPLEERILLEERIFTGSGKLVISKETPGYLLACA